MRTELRGERIYQRLLTLVVWCAIGAALIVNVGLVLSPPRAFGSAKSNFWGALSIGWRSFLSTGLAGVAQIFMSFNFYLRGSGKENPKPALVAVSMLFLLSGIFSLIAAGFIAYPYLNVIVK